MQPEDPTHYAYFDIQVDGRDVGRLDFELFGKEAPKTVNNFLAFCSGDFNPYMRYKGSNILSIHE